MMARFAIAVFVLVSALACAGDESTPAGQLWETCDDAHVCAQGLACLNKFCTVQCQASNLTCSQSGAGDIYVGGACFIGCSPTVECPADLLCTMAGTTTGTCRPR